MPANPGIQVCYPPGEDTRGPGQFWGRDTLLSKLEEHGLRLQRVERPGSSGIVLLFAALEGLEVGALDGDARGRIVLVADGEKPTPEGAEAAREAAGFLGLVEPDAWSKWKRGPYVAWGFYGRRDIAKVAGLAPVGAQGLQPIGDSAALPEVLALFLAAAEAVAKNDSNEPIP